MAGRVVTGRSPAVSEEAVGDMPTIDSLDEIVDLASRHRPLFVRYSDGPQRDLHQHSRDYEADVELPGISVAVLSPEPWWTRPVEDWVARRICKYSDLNEKDDSRRPWLLLGKVAGSGPDHEPIVCDVVPLAWVGRRALSQAVELYHARFEVGRDSTEASSEDSDSSEC